MSQLNRQLLSINDELYLIKKIIRQEEVKDIEPIKTSLLASHVFKKDEMLYFCDIIPNLEIIEQENQLQEQEKQQEQ